MATRRAKQWVAQNPVKAVIASKAAGYYGATIPVEASANEAVSFGFDRDVDLGQMLERAFKERMTRINHRHRLLRRWHDQVNGGSELVGFSRRLGDRRRRY